MIINPDDIDVGSAVITYRFPAGVALPEIGESLEDSSYIMTVIDVNKEESSIKVMVTPADEGNSNMLLFLEKLDKAEQQISEDIYKLLSDPMMSCIGWENLPEDEREIYLKCSKGIIDLLNKEGLLSVKC